MRSDATTQEVELARSGRSPVRYRIRVEVDTDGSGASFVDLSDWHGYDYVRSFSRTRSLDAPAISATVNFAAWIGHPIRNSLSPAMVGSTLNAGGPLCKPYNRIKVSLAVWPSGGKPASLTYHLLFEGRIDGWRQQGNSFELRCRDLICDLQDTTIELERQYGVLDPTTVAYSNMEEIIQNILDDNVNTTASAPRTNALSARVTDGDPWQLYSANGDSTTPWNAGDNTGAGVRLDMVPKRPVWEAISMYPQGIAYRLSRRWHNGTGINGFVLVLEEPDRVATTPAMTLDPLLGECKVIGDDLDRDNIRNRILVGFQSAGGKRDYYFANDATSEGDYGKRFAGMSMGAASQVDTLAEATKMGDGALADVKDPLLQMSIETKLMWFIELNDLLRISPDNVHFDAQQDLAVISARDTVQQGGAATTTFQLRGKPCAGILRHTVAQRAYESRIRDLVGIPLATNLHSNANFSGFRAI